MAEIKAEPVPAQVQAAPEEKPPKQKTGRFGSLRKRLSMDRSHNNDNDGASGRIAELEAKNTELATKNSELESMVQKLRNELHESSQAATAASTELLVRCDSLSDNNTTMTERLKELTGENGRLKDLLSSANRELEDTKSDLTKARSEAEALDSKLAKARRPIFGFGSRSLSATVPQGSALASPRSSLVSPRNHNSLDPSESWYGRFCGQPSDGWSNPASTPRGTTRGPDSVESWYGRFCGLTEEE